jgi:hypothetical protein
VSIDRNDPCPCGSGRKYKHCCLVKSELVDARWQAWRRAEGAVVESVLDFADEQWGAPLFDEAFGTFFVGQKPHVSLDDGKLWEQLLIPWFVFDFVPEPRRRRRGEGGPAWPTTTLAQEYARQYESRLTPVEARFLQAASDAPLSFTVVTAYDQGRSLDLKDILTGEDYHVLERSGSASLGNGEILLARVVRDGDMAVFCGLGPYPLPPGDHNRIIDFREQFLRRRGSLDRARVKALSLEIVLVYRQFVEQLLNPAPPKLQNTDGDPLEPTTLEFELRCSVQQAFDRLKQLSLVKSDDELVSDAERSDSGELSKAILIWGKKGNKLHKDWDNTTLGTLTITGGTLEVFVNSAKRAKKIRGLIEKYLGVDALYLRQTIESVKAMLDPSRRREVDDDEDANGPRVDSTPEGRALLAEVNRRHWEAWLDAKVPALGNLTPRQAAKTPLGRERLEALLAEFTWRQHANPQNAIKMDLDRLRQQLGLPRT